MKYYYVISWIEGNNYGTFTCEATGIKTAMNKFWCGERIGARITKIYRELLG